ncbi:MAG: NUDIX domain-containing protein [Nanoarchaeota archaeon]
MTSEIALVVPVRDRQLLLQLRDDHAPTRKNLWSFFGGSIEGSESPLEAAVREYKEELDIVSQNGLDYAFTVERVKPSGTFVKHIFLDHLHTTFSHRIKEGKEARFFHQDELYSIAIKPSDHKLGLMVFAHINKIKPDADFSHELSWWDSHLQGKDAYAEHLKDLLDPTRRHLRFPQPLRKYLKGQGNPIRGLEIGSGPTSTLAWAVDTGLLQLTAVDPLAEAYQRLLTGRGYDQYPVKPIDLSGEQLLSYFEPESFELIYMRNSLDHTQYPRIVLANAVELLAPGGILYIEGHVKEGTHARWQGLHKYDFIPREGSLICTSEQGETCDLTANLPLTTTEHTTQDLPQSVWYNLVMRRLPFPQFIPLK